MMHCSLGLQLYPLAESLPRRNAHYRAAEIEMQGFLLAHRYIQGSERGPMPPFFLATLNPWRNAMLEGGIAETV